MAAFLPKYESIEKLSLTKSEVNKIEPILTNSMCLGMYNSLHTLRSDFAVLYSYFLLKSGYIQNGDFRA